VEVIRQTPADGRRKQMAEQQDSAAAHADLEQSGGFALDPDDIITNGGDGPPARSSELPVGANMQDGAVAFFHEALMSSERRAFIAFRLRGRGGRCILPAVF
jgi:hypothetical protein